MWHKIDNNLNKNFIFSDFKSALEFVNKVGVIAEERNHHPDIELGWGRVNISITTHSEGKITNKDRQLAEAIDTLVSSE